MRERRGRKTEERRWRVGDSKREISKDERGEDELFLSRRGGEKLKVEERKRDEHVR